jgi:hypothetical protein
MTMRWLRLILVLGLIGAAAPAGGHHDKLQALRDALAAGQPVVLALARELPTEDSESETAADWATYLNDFAAEHAGYRAVAMDAAQARELLAEPPPLEDFYATIFVRAADSAVIYDGPVLETSVYDAAAAYLEDPAGTFDPELFERYTLRLR